MPTMTVTAVVASRLAERTSLAGRPDNPHLPLVPEGLCHAFVLGDVATLCGLPTGDLAMFPGLCFADATFLLRCDDCAQRLGTTV